jgi:integrase
MSKPAFPITVKRGNVRVKIYLTPSNGCAAHTVAYYFGGRRVRKVFADLDRAKLEAETVASSLCAGELDVLTLTNVDRSAYVRCRELLQPSGTPLELAVLQFAEAERILQGRSLVEAAKFFARQNPTGVASKRVPEVVAELLAARQSQGVSAKYLRMLRGLLQRFGAAFNVPINLLLAPELQDYLRDLKTTVPKGRGPGKASPRPVSAVTKNNARKALQILFAFARSRGYLPKGRTEANELQCYKAPPTPIEIFTPTEMAQLLRHTEPRLGPFLAIGAFAGLRHAEILRLDWREVDLAGGHIEVRADKAKTARRRLVPVSENLRQWLAPLREESGLVVGLDQVDHLLKRVATAAGVPWKHNALRHSFISYRVAQTQNVAQVALEAGNSPQIIFSNYRELVKPAAAVKWFAIVPETPANVVALPHAAAA